MHTKYAETMDNVKRALDLLMFRRLNKATLKSRKSVYKTAFKEDANSASLSSS